MTNWATLVIVSAYLVGLLATGITEARVLGGLSVAGIGVLITGVICGEVVPRNWRLGPTRKQWLVAGVVGLVAASYCVAATPQAAANDVSKFASRQAWRVTGKVLQMPQSGRNNKARFTLEAQSIRGEGSRSSIEAPRPVSGKLYVTAALGPSKRLYPGEIVELKGKIQAVEKEQDGKLSGFGSYLSRQGCFAKFQTYWIEFLPGQEPPKWALWKLRQRIVLAQNKWLGEPAGNLVSAMTLGRKAVDLPVEVRDSFVDAGLAHTLAASGFHVSLLLALVLWVMKTRQPKTQAITGICVLVGYVGLTGLQASVLRASLMGAGTLLGLAMKRKVNPLGGLLAAATLLLIWNPQFIWDAGFQLSVMATLGLILMARGLMKRLDFLPTGVAGVLAVPMAAYFWTVPLQLLYFGVLPTYSVLLNVIATPFVVFISMGGFVSAIAAIVWPWLGSAIATNLYYPIHLLIWLVDKFNQLPGNSFQLEGVRGWHVVCIYGMYAAVCIWLWRRKVRSDIEDAELVM